MLNIEELMSAQQQSPIVSTAWLAGRLAGAGVVAIEQLVAESTGKRGHGVLPIVDEPLGDAAGVLEAQLGIDELEVAGEHELVAAFRGGLAAGDEKRGEGRKDPLHGVERLAAAGGKISVAAARRQACLMVREHHGFHGSHG